MDDNFEAIGKIGWARPTDIQKSVIPLVLESKNIVIQGRTGSGKTGAYAIPLINKIISEKQMRINSSNCFTYDPRTILSENPDIIISTPSRLLKTCHHECLDFKGITKVVVDEADLMTTFGYVKDIQNFSKQLKNVSQYVLLSATSDDSVKQLRKLFVPNAEWTKVELEEDSYLPNANQLSQYIVRAEEDDKYVVISTLLKLRLVKGKTIIFANSIDRCYKLRLFLEEFGIKSALLNCELPASCRIHAIEQFNQGMYDYLICTDDTTDQTSKLEKVEYGVSRGIDFQLVSNIINFDFPLNPPTYVHRVGRTARGDQFGTSISFVSQGDVSVMCDTEKYLKSANSEVFRQYLFNKEEVDGFRYRALDVKKKITRQLIRNVRLKEIKLEIMNSEKLKSYFNSHVNDYNALRHDKIINKTSYGHMKDIPEYLIPPSLKKVLNIKAGSSNSSSRSGFRKRRNKMRSELSNLQKSSEEGVKLSRVHDRIVKPIVLSKESAASQALSIGNPKLIRNPNFVKKVKHAKRKANDPLVKISSKTVKRK